jgi:hypothetical protein
MHTGPIDPEDRFGHEGGVIASRERLFLNYETVQHGEICHTQGLLILQVYLVLAGGDLMMRTFHRNADFLQRRHGPLPEMGSFLDG